MPQSLHLNQFLLAARYSLVIAAALLAGCNMQQGGSTAGTAVTTPPAPPNPLLDTRVAAYDEAARLTRDPVTKARSLFDKGAAQMYGRRFADASATFAGIAAEWADSDRIELQRYAASSLNNLGQSRKMLGQRMQEMAAYDEVVRRFGEGSDLPLRRSVIAAIAHKAEAQVQIKQWEAAPGLQAIATGSRCVDRDDTIQTNCARILRCAADMRKEQALHAEAERLYAEVANRFATYSAAAVQQEVLVAHVKRGGVLLDHLGKSTEARAAFEAALAIKPGTSSVARFNRGVAMVNRATILQRAGRTDEASAQYAQAISEYEADSSAGGQFIVNRAMLNRGYLLQNNRQPAEALALFDRALVRAERVKSPMFQEQVVTAMVGRAQALLRLQRLEESTAAFDAVIRRADANQSPSIREMAAKAALAKGAIAQMQQLRGEIKGVTASIDAKILAEQDKPEPQRSDVIATLTVAKAALLGSVGYFDEAADIYDAVVASHANADRAVLRRLAASALYSKALLLNNRGTPLDAGRAMRSLISRFGGMDDEEIKKTVRNAEQWLEFNRQAEPVG